MKVIERSYNVITIDAGDITPGTAKVIGTNLDYLAVKKITQRSGILRVKCKISNFPMFGTMSVNPWQLEDKLECTCVTYAGEDLKAVIATIEPSDDGMKATVILADITTS